jgi:transcription elongation factor Elf1
MPDGRPSVFDLFTCPNCDALYHVIKVEAGPETDSRGIVCRACGGALAAREGNLILKYFLFRKPVRNSAPNLAAAR